MTNEELQSLISQLDTKQREALEKHIEFEAYPDIEKANLSNLKRKIYEKYAKVISDLVAKTEVYVHDLPKQICGLIETVFRILTTSSAEPDENDQIRLCAASFKYENFLVDTLRAVLIDCYIKRIKQYHKILNKFNHKAVKIGSSPFMKEINRLSKCLKKEYKQGKKKFKTQYSLGIFEYLTVLGKFTPIEKVFPVIEKILPYNIDIYLDICNNKISEFENCIKDAEMIIAHCEDNYALIINNGYNSSLLRRLISHIPELISFAFTVYAAIVFLMKRI